MSVLARFPRWLRIALLAADLAAATGVLVAYWTASYPNLIAAWFQFAAIAAIALPLGAWLGREFPRWQEHIARRAAERTAAHLTEHHETTRAHITEQLAGHAAAQNDRLDVITDQLAALHARLNRQGDGTP